MSLSFFGNRFGGANVFTSRDAFLEVGGFTEYVDVGCEDYEFLVRAALKGVSQVVIPEPLLWVRRYKLPHFVSLPPLSPLPPLSLFLLSLVLCLVLPPPVLTASFLFSSSKINHWYALDYGRFSLQTSSPLTHIK